MTLRLATQLQLLHRPHLITPAAAMELANRIRAIDPRAFERRAGPFVSMRRKLARALESTFNGLRADAYDMSQVGEVEAMEDDEAYGRPRPPPRPGAYTPLWMGAPDVRLEWGWSVKDGIAVMEINGPLAERGGDVCGEWIHGYDTIAAAIAEADANGAVEAMLIRFDTPGGVVASGLDDLTVMLQSRGGNAKPLKAHCEMACSAGYWIASQCDSVLAPKAGLTGSIGAVLVHEDYSAALEKMGVKITSIEFPADGLKTEGAPWKGLSEEGLADLQAMINHCGEAFLGAVESGRGGKLSAKQAVGLKARVFTSDNADKSRSALSIGLIDAVMSEQEAFNALKSELGASIIPIRPAAKAGPKPAGAKAPASTAAAAAQPTETDMALRAAITAAIAKADALNKEGKPFAGTLREDMQQVLDDHPDEDPPADPPEDKPEDGAAAADDPPADETEEEKKKREEEEAKAKASGAGGKPSALATAQAILALPEAKGRETLAHRLAFKPGATVEDAKADLAAAPIEPKASRLAGMKDVRITSTDANDNRSAGQKEADEALQIAGLKKVPAKT